MNEKVTVLVVGCGGISATWLSCLGDLPEVEVVGLLDIDESAAGRRREEFNLERTVVGTDLGALLKRTKPDVIWNLAIPAAHHAITMEALAAGCHVLSEKPLANSMAEAREMVAAAEAAGRVFAVMQNRRYNKNIRALRHFLESGRIGGLSTVNCDFYLGAHFGGFRDQMRHVLLLDMAIHSFDQARLISGADPVSVYCHEWNPRGSWYDRDASAVAIFEMSDGVVFTYRGSWCCEGANTSWECDWRIQAERGCVLWNGADGFKAQAVGGTGGFLSEMEDCAIAIGDHGSKTGGHLGCIREFTRCVQEGGAPETAAEDNIRSLAMVFGAIESAETGHKVNIVI